MHLPPFDYTRPNNLADCLEALENPGESAVLACGTDLLVSMKLRLAKPRTLISVKSIPELQAVTMDASGDLHIGAACTLTSLAENPLVADHFPALQQAIRSVGSRHVRNVGTLAGNLCLDTRCWYTDQSEDWRNTRPTCYKTEGDVCHVIKSATRCHSINSSDTAPALIALNARVMLVTRGAQREIPLADFYQDDGDQHTVLQSGELLTSIVVPKATDRSVFIKIAQRVGLDYAAGTIAVAIGGQGERVETATLVIGSIGSWPIRLRKAEAILLEQGLTDAGIDAAAEAARADLGEVNNLFSPPGYKRRLIKSIVRRALIEIRQA